MGTRAKVLVALAAVLALGVASLASAQGGHGRKHVKRVEVLTVTTKPVQEADLDLGQPGLGAGDRFTFSEDIYIGDRLVGMDGGECVIVRVTPNPVPEGQEPESATTQCVVTARLPKGQITLQGLVDFADESGSFDIAITGGTGAYRTAHGVARVTSGDESDTVRLKIIR